MSPEVGRNIPDDDALQRVERPRRKLTPREFGADRIPPISSRRLLCREIRVRKKIQIENLLRNCFIVIWSDLQRPIEMLDCGGSFSQPSETSAQQSETDFGSRILLEHLFAGDDRLRHAAREHADLRLPPPCQF